MSVERNAKRMGTNGEAIDMRAGFKHGLAALAVVAMVGCGSAEAGDTR